jgi:hypothetical protein
MFFRRGKSAGASHFTLQRKHEGIAVDAGLAGRGRGLSAGFEHRDAFFVWSRL